MSSGELPTKTHRLFLGNWNQAEPMTESRLYHKLVRQRLTFRSLDGGRAELKFPGWRKIRDMLPSDIVRSVTSICIHISRRKQQGRHAASTCQDRVVDQHVTVKRIHPRLS